MFYMSNFTVMNHDACSSVVLQIAAICFIHMGHLRLNFTLNITQIHMLILQVPLLGMCNMGMCQRQCRNVKSLTAYLKEHIAKGRVVTCPVTGCDHTFTVRSSFTAHVSSFSVSGN